MEKLMHPFNDLLQTNIKGMTKKQHDGYLEEIKRRNGGSLDDIETVIILDGDKDHVNVEYVVQDRLQPRFERIRRITGYLVGTVDRWNDAKKAELKDRVKHA